MVGGEPFDGAREQEDNGLNRCWSKAGSGLQFEDNAGFCRLAVVQKNRLLGKGEVDAGRFDYTQTGDGALQFAFERTLVIDLFRKLGEGKVRFVENLETNAAGAGEALRGEIEAKLGEAGAADIDTRSIVADFVLDVLLAETGGKVASVFGGHLGEQELEVFLFLELNKPVDPSAGDQKGEGERYLLAKS